MQSSLNLKRQQIKKYESMNFELMSLHSNEEYYKAYEKVKSKRSEKLAKAVEIKAIPTVYLSRVIVQVLEGLQQYLATEFTLLKVDKSKLNAYWQFLECSMIFTFIEAQIYIQDQSLQDNDAFTPQILRITQYFISSTHLLLDNPDEDIQKNWMALFDYFEKIINFNFNKMSKYKEIFSAQYFCLECIKNVIESFKRSEKYVLNSKQLEIMQEITTQVINSKMREYILDDDEAQDASSFEDSKLQEGIYPFQNTQMREIKYSAEFNTLQNSKSIHLQQVENSQIITPCYKNAKTDQQNLDDGLKEDKLKQPQSAQKIQSEYQSFSQFDSQNNQQNTNSSNSQGQTSMKNKEQSVSVVQQDNLSTNTNSSNKAKQIQQQLQQQQYSLIATLQPQSQSVQLQQQQQQPPLIQKGKRDSILLPSSQFEFQSNIKSGGGIFSTNSNHGNQQQENTANISYSSQFLCKEEDIFNQNGDNTVINNGFFSRKVSDNLLDDLDYIQQYDVNNLQKQPESANKIQSASQTQISHNTSVSSVSGVQKSQDKSENSQTEKKKEDKKSDKISEIKLKKYSQDSQNGRTREFSFKYDIKEQKKEGNGRTIFEIESFINKELAGLNEDINEFTQMNTLDEQQIESYPIPLVTRHSVANTVSRRSKVRGSNLQTGNGKVSSDLSAYDQHSSRLDDRNSQSGNDNDIDHDNESVDSSNSINSSFSNDNFSSPHQIYNKIKQQKKMEKYIFNGNYDNDEIIMDQSEEDDEDEEEDDEVEQEEGQEEEEENISSSKENRQSYTRNRSNVQVQHQAQFKSRGSKFADIPRPSLLRKDNFSIRKRSKLQDGIENNINNTSESQQENTMQDGSLEQTSTLNDDERNQYEQQLAELKEIEDSKGLTQEELSLIQEEIRKDFFSIVYNLDSTLVDNGIGKNFKKYKYPLEIKPKMTDYNKRVQEKYKLLQNYQHLLGVDSTMFANDQNQVDSTRKIVVTNNIEYLKMMNKLPEDEEENNYKKKKKIQESQKRFSLMKKYSKKKNTFDTTLKKMQENEGGLEDILEQSSEIKKQRPMEIKNEVGIQKNSQIMDQNNRGARKSKEQIVYNAIQDEIEEDDRHFYDQDDRRGFTHQIYAVTKHNYYQEFKQHASQDILDRVFQTFDTYMKAEKEQTLRMKRQSDWKDSYKSYDDNNDDRVAQYSLFSEINEKCVQIPIQQLLKQSEFSWSKAKLTADAKLAESRLAQNNILSSFKHKRSVVIQEDQMNELILRQKNLSSSPSKKQSISFKKARKRSGSLNPEANQSSEDDNSFAQGIKKFQLFYNKSNTSTLQKVQGRQSLIS